MGDYAKDVLVDTAWVAEHEEDQRKRRADYERDTDIEDMLALKNERRARKGLPPLTRAEYEASLDL